MKRVCFGTHEYGSTCGACNRAVAMSDLVVPPPAQAEAGAAEEAIPEPVPAPAVVPVTVRLRRRRIIRGFQPLVIEPEARVQPEAPLQPEGEAQVQQEIWRCNLCPTEDIERNMMPPEPEDMANAPRCTLMCGHEVHTHCVFNIIYGDNYITRCRECLTSFLRPQAFNHYHQNNPRQPQNTNIKKLWEENEEFRKEICTFKKRTTEVNSLQKKYVSSISGIKERFRDVIKTNIEIIKMQKKLFSKELSALPGRRMFLSKATRLKNLKRRICQKYDVDAYDTFKVLTEDTTLTPKPPKFSKDTYRSLWRFRTTYIFRVRI